MTDEEEIVDTTFVEAGDPLDEPRDETTTEEERVEATRALVNKENSNAPSQEQIEPELQPLKHVPVDLEKESQWGVTQDGTPERVPVENTTRPDAE